MGAGRVGVIGGSGLYQIAALEIKEKVELLTPFGQPSAAFILGSLEGVEIVFLPRHGERHTLSPPEINFRANIYGMKMMGVQWLISMSAVGSMKEEIAPGHIVIPDQFVDCTKGRAGTFFSGGVVAHIPFADPVCPQLSQQLFEAAKACGATVHRGGTYLCIEGPQFSTRAESRIYRSWGVDVIGMTNLPEAKLAREAELCYSTLALTTDYDCWHAEREDVTVSAILETVKANADLAARIIKQVLPQVGSAPPCPCQEALENVFLTPPRHLPEHIKRDLDVLIGKYC